METGDRSLLDALERLWRPGDVVKLDLPMEPRLIEAHPKLEACRGQVAVMRGPLVYCLESPDLPDGVHVEEIRVPSDTTFVVRHEPGLLGGVAVLDCEARRTPAGDWSSQLYRSRSTERVETVSLRLIPYYAWANRGVSEMTVWMPLC